MQVVQATYATATSIASTSFTNTGLSGTITPTLATSKILVMVTQGFGIFNSPDSGSFFGSVNLNRQIGAGSFSVVYSPGPGSNEMIGIGSGGQQNRSLVSMQYIDSPATTSAVTYKTQALTNQTANNQSINFQINSTATSILIMMEIGA